MYISKLTRKRLPYAIISLLNFIENLFVYFKNKCMVKLFKRLIVTWKTSLFL